MGRDMRIVLESEGFEILAGEIAFLPADPDETSKDRQLEFTSVPFVGNTVSESSMDQPEDYFPVLIKLRVRRNGEADTVTAEGLTLRTVAVNRDDIKNQEYRISVPRILGRLQVRVLDSQDQPLPGESVEISWLWRESPAAKRTHTGNFQLFLTVGSYRVTLIGGQEAEVTIRSFEDSHIVLRGPARKDEIR